MSRSISTEVLCSKSSGRGCCCWPSHCFGPRSQVNPGFQWRLRSLKRGPRHQDPWKIDFNVTLQVSRNCPSLLVPQPRPVLNAVVANVVSPFFLRETTTLQPLSSTMSSIRGSKPGLIPQLARSLPRTQLQIHPRPRPGLPCQRRPAVPILPTGNGSKRTIATFTPPYQAHAISTIQSAIDTSSDEFKENKLAMDEAMGRLTELTRKVQQGGPQKARDKHLARKKMLPRDRITALVDPGTTFMELGGLAGHELYPEAEVPAAGIITGVGVVEGVTCVIVANDSTVKGGTYYPITVKKHLRAQAVAQENKLP